MKNGSELRLVLWDIDHTLISFGGVGLDSYAAAFTRATGQPWNMTFSFGGLTERATVAEVLRSHGVESDPRLVTTFFSYLEDEHRARADHMAEHGTVLPGAAEALAALAAMDRVRQSVLTGNLRTIALLKLELFGLGSWLDLAIGAFGDEDTERANLVPRAWRRAENLRGEVFGAAQTVLIGDTVRDVEAALANGAGAVAVASGITTAAQLRAAGADVVLDSLVETERVVTAIHAASAAAARR